MRLPAIAILFASVLLSACASIIHGSNQEVGISSYPSNATVTVDGVRLGPTPVFAKLARKDNHTIRIELAGYEPFETTLTRKVSGWIWGNIFNGLIVGIVIDDVTGALYRLTPEQVSSQLTRAGVDHSLTGGGVYIVLTREADPQWQRTATLSRK